MAKKEKEKAYNYITEGERYQIEILLKKKCGIKEIADAVGHKYHTVRNEIIKGTVTQIDTQLVKHEVYKADYAQMVSEQNMSNRGRNLKIGADHELAAYIETMVKDKYSPEALLLHARNEGITFKTSLCPKTIYNYFDMGLFLNVTYQDLPQKKAMRRKKERKSTVSLNNRFGESIEKTGSCHPGTGRIWTLGDGYSRGRPGERHILSAGALGAHDKGRDHHKDAG